MRLKPIILISMTVLAMLTVVLWLFGDQWVKRIIERKIAGVENLAYDSLDIDIASKSISFRGLTYTPAETSIRAKKVSVENIEIYQWLISNKPVVERIEVDSMEMTHWSIPDTSGMNFNFKIHDLESQLLIKELSISQAFFEMIESDSVVRVETSLELVAEDMYLDNMTQPEDLLNHLTSFTATDLKFLTYDGLYHYGTNEVNYTAGNHKIIADSTFIHCVYDKYELGHLIGHEKTWLSLEVDSICIITDNLRKSLTEYKSSYLTLYDANLQVFRDKRLPFNPLQRPKLLCEQLADSSLSLGLDSILFVNTNITYEEFAKEGDGPGMVSFNNLNGYLSNLYSFQHNRAIPPHLVVTSDLYDVAKLYTDISFASAPGGKTLVKAKLEPMDLRAINQMLKYVAFIEVEQGYTDGLDLEFTYDQIQSKGTMHFYYDGLKIDFLRKKSAETGGWLNELKGFIVNTFVVQSSNTPQSGNFRVGQISFEREIERSMYTYWWKSALSGIKSSTGIPTLRREIDQN